MKIKYNYFSLRFPNKIALLCLQVQDLLNAKYIDLPFLLPVESKFCEYRDADFITYENRKYYVANDRMDVYVMDKAFAKERYFGVINISRNTFEYVLWTNFYDKKIEGMMAALKGCINIRIYNNPLRVSATIECDDDDV